MSRKLFACASVLAVAAILSSEPAMAQSGIATSQDSLAADPLLAAWSGPYDGVPAFNKVAPEKLRRAFNSALAMHRADIAAIAGNRAPPTFDNTIAALERASQPYRRVNMFLDVFSGSMSDAEWQAVDKELSPKRAAVDDELVQNGALFRRIEAVWNSPEKARLTPEQLRLLWRTHDAFVRQGARLTPSQKLRLGHLNQELAKYYTEFSQRVLEDENSWTTLASESDLAGVPEALRAVYKAAADERGLAGKWAIVNTRSSVDEFLTYSARRDLRKIVWTTFKNRGDMGGATNTNELISKIVRLRADKAKLLGYPTFADWKLGDKMAKTPKRASDLMLRVWTPTAARIRREVADMRAIAAADGMTDNFEPWDYLYYAEKVRKAKYDIDRGELKNYFELNKMIDASMWMAGRLYGLSFREISGQVPVYHPDMRVWEVRKGRDFVGLFYGDYFARAGKRSGAWELAYRSQSDDGVAVTPIVSVNHNIVKGAPGEPVLLPLDDAETLFHEFGHALHDLLSKVRYGSLAGTNTATDFVEFPSQVHENWLLTPEILDRFARHYRTGEAMPPELLAKLQKAAKFNQGYATGEYLASAIVDMELHTVPNGTVDAGKFEREVMARIGVPDEIVMRHRLPHFTHLFSSEAYGAGYYSYLWSDTMGADAWKAFVDTGNVWDRKTAERLRLILEAGDSVDQIELYRNFRGRDPDVDALLEQRGFDS